MKYLALNGKGHFTGARKRARCFMLRKPWFGPHGFTLIEVLVVIAIVGVIASIIFVALNSARKKARDVRRKVDITQIGRFVFYGGCYVPNAGPGDYDFMSLVPELTAAYPQYAQYASQIPRDPRVGTDADAYYFYQYATDGNGPHCIVYANFENENEPVTLPELTAPAAGGGTGVLRASANGWNGSPIYHQVGK